MDNLFFDVLCFFFQFPKKEENLSVSISLFRVLCKKEESADEVDRASYSNPKLYELKLILRLQFSIPFPRIYCSSFRFFFSFLLATTLGKPQQTFLLYIELILGGVQD